MKGSSSGCPQAQQNGIPSKNNNPEGKDNYTNALYNHIEGNSATNEKSACDSKSNLGNTVKHIFRDIQNIASYV